MTKVTGTLLGVGSNGNMSLCEEFPPEASAGHNTRLCKETGHIFCVSSHSQN